MSEGRPPQTLLSFARELCVEGTGEKVRASGFREGECISDSPRNEYPCQERLSFSAFILTGE